MIQDTRCRLFPRQVVTAHGDELAERLRLSDRDAVRASDGSEASTLVAELEDRLQQSEQRIMSRLAEVMEQVDHVQQRRGGAGGEPTGLQRAFQSSAAILPKELSKEQRKEMAALACLAGVATSALCMTLVFLVKGGG
eukprot:9207637-Pyramimonas_sp.AAC.1